MKITSDRFKASLHVYACGSGKDSTGIKLKHCDHYGESKDIYIEYEDIEKFKEVFEAAYVEAKVKFLIEDVE